MCRVGPTTYIHTPLADLVDCDHLPHSWTYYTFMCMFASTYLLSSVPKWWGISTTCCINKHIVCTLVHPQTSPSATPNKDNANMSPTAEGSTQWSHTCVQCIHGAQTWKTNKQTQRMLELLDILKVSFIHSHQAALIITSGQMYINIKPMMSWTKGNIPQSGVQGHEVHRPRMTSKRSSKHA